MFLSKHPNGTYYLYYNDERGKRQKVSTRCGHKADALAFLQTFEKQEHERKKNANRRLLSTFVTEFLEYAQGNLAKGTVAIYRSTLRNFTSIVGNLPLISFTPQHFDKYKTERLKRRKLRGVETVKPVTVNIELRALRSCFNTAVRWRFIPNNPFARQKLASIPDQTPIFFTKEDFQKLLIAIKHEWLKEIVIFATLTGLRRGELVNLRWREVDLQRHVIIIQSNATFKTKQGRKRVLPLSDTAFYLLRSKLGQVTYEHVFTLNGKKIFEDWLTHAFKKAVMDAKLEDKRLHFHSIRHTFATWLVQDGVGIYEVQKLLGHSSISVTQVYSHLAAGELHSAVNRISLPLN